MVLNSLWSDSFAIREQSEKLRGLVGRQRRARGSVAASRFAVALGALRIEVVARAAYVRGERISADSHCGRKTQNGRGSDNT
jgi:hypothetical protein